MWLYDWSNHSWMCLQTTCVVCQAHSQWGSNQTPWIELTSRDYTVNAVHVAWTEFLLRECKSRQGTNKGQRCAQKQKAVAVQSMKLLREALLMTDNDGKKKFPHSTWFLTCCTASVLHASRRDWTPSIQNPTLYKAGYGPVWHFSMSAEILDVSVYTNNMSVVCTLQCEYWAELRRWVYKHECVYKQHKCCMYTSVWVLSWGGECVHKQHECCMYTWVHEYWVQEYWGCEYDA